MLIVNYISGFLIIQVNKVNNIAIFNLLKSKKYNAYIDQEKDAKDIFEKHAKGIEGWHVMKKRNGCKF